MEASPPRLIKRGLTNFIKHGAGHGGDADQLGGFRHTRREGRATRMLLRSNHLGGHRFWIGFIVSHGVSIRLTPSSRDEYDGSHARATHHRRLKTEGSCMATSAVVPAWR